MVSTARRRGFRGIEPYLDAVFPLVPTETMSRKPTSLPKGPALVKRVVVATGIIGLGLGCGGDVAPPPQTLDAGKDAPAPQPADSGVTKDAGAQDALADVITPQPPPQPPQPPPQPPQPPPQPPQPPH